MSEYANALYAAMQAPDEAKTRWHEPHEFPERPGFYERDFGLPGEQRRVLVSYWDGKNWSHTKGGMVSDVRVRWRGLKEEPK